MATTQQQVKEDPAALLQRTNLAEYLRARKALAAQAAQQGAPTRPVLPFLLRTDHSVQEVRTSPVVSTSISSISKSFFLPAARVRCSSRM